MTPPEPTSPWAALELRALATINASGGPTHRSTITLPPGFRRRLRIAAARADVPLSEILLPLVDDLLHRLPDTLPDPPPGAPETVTIRAPHSWWRRLQIASAALGVEPRTVLAAALSGLPEGVS